MLCSLLPVITAWAVTSSSPPHVGVLTRGRAGPTECLADDRVDTLVLYGDAGVLVGYGVVQSIVDISLQPFATAQPELFTQDQPVLAAQWQGLALAALWVLITSLLDGYSPDATRTLPSRDAVTPLVTAWLGSSLALLGLFSLLGLPLEAEAEFVFGSATVIGGWRFLYSQSLPLP